MGGARENRAGRPLIAARPTRFDLACKSAIAPFYRGWAGCGAGAGAGCGAGAGVGVAAPVAGAVPEAGTALASRVGAA